MAFWSSETLHTRLPSESIVTPFDSSHVKYGAYELTLASELFITSSPDAVKRQLQKDEQVSIPAGQFALLLSRQSVRIPHDTIAFISIKASIKLGGLINVSGFHVDPGFHGQLKFSVYNAGSENVILQEGQRVFLIWFATLDRTTEDIYKGDHQHQSGISPQDVTILQGDLASPAVLKKAIDDLRHDHDKKIASLETRYVVGLTLLGTFVVGIAGTCAREYLQKPLEENRGSSAAVEPRRGTLPIFAPDTQLLDTGPKTPRTGRQ